MRDRLYRIAIVLIASFFSSLLFGQEGDVQPAGVTNYEFTSYLELYEQLINLQPDPARVAAVSNFSFQRDVAEFSLNSGELYLLSPVGNRICAAVFLGEGTISIAPPTEIEQEQLYRFYETRSIQQAFSRLFLIFADSTQAELEKHLSFETRKVPGEVSGFIRDGLSYVSEDKGKYFDSSIIKTFLENESNEFFMAFLKTEKMGMLIFKINPYAEEEVSLLRRASTSWLIKHPEVICQFHKQEDYASKKNLGTERKDHIKVLTYKIESTIEGNLDFSAIAEIEFASLMKGQKWIEMDMYYDMVLDSVFWDNGKKAQFFKAKDNPFLWIKCDAPLSKRELRRIKLYYHSNSLLERNEYAWIYLKDPGGWFPSYGNRKATSFDLTFHTPSKFTFVCVGDPISAENKGDVISTRWITPRPINYASFNLGDFRKYEVPDTRIPPVTVYMSAGGHREIAQAHGATGGLSGINMEKQVGGDVANSIALFQGLFGESGMKQFYATEIPYYHGQAFPGLIHLSWVTFQVTGEKGYDEIFRAHEVAHQWWGIGVDFETYHDQWISEAFSEFCGLWYMQTRLKDKDKYFDRLNDYRKQVFNNRKFLFGSGQEAGPIWLGYRTSSSETAGDYDLIIYKKGAWVLHMLRAMMIDLDNMNEDRFKNMLKDFYSTYRGRKASTEDFQKIVEKHIWTEMDWFFKQWVYGTDIPVYKFSYKTEETNEGKFQVRCRIKQEEVPPDYRAYVNLLVDYGKERISRTRIHINQPQMEIDLPLMPYKPKKIVFNDLESVLCEVKEENWQ